jgi:hypothetical protein
MIKVQRAYRVIMDLEIQQQHLGIEWTDMANGKILLVKILHLEIKLVVLK